MLLAPGSGGNAQPCRLTGQPGREADCSDFLWRMCTPTRQHLTAATCVNLQSHACGAALGTGMHRTVCFRCSCGSRRCIRCSACRPSHQCSLLRYDPWGNTVNAKPQIVDCILRRAGRGVAGFWWLAISIRVSSTFLCPEHDAACRSNQPVHGRCRRALGALGASRSRRQRGCRARRRRCRERSSASAAASPAATEQDGNDPMGEPRC